MSLEDSEMSEKPSNKVIDGGTLMPISFLVMLLVGVSRVELTSFKTNANEKELESQKAEIKELSSSITEIKTSLGRIEGALGTRQKQVEGKENEQP